MVGVLNSQFGVYDDTIPLPGGVGQDDYFSGVDVVPLPGGADDFYFNPPDIGDYQPEAGAVPAAPRGPLAQAGAAMPTPPQQPDTTVQGPLAATSPQNLQMSLIDAAQQRIMDYRRQQDAAKAGQINMPLLAAAGALLSPTRTGSLGESIGNAFSAAAPAVQRQRAMDMQEAQARAKEDWNMAYQQAVLQDRGKWRDIQQQRADVALDQWRPTGQVDENNNPILVNGRGEMRVETGVKVGAKPSAAGEWTNTGKVDENGNAIMFNKRDGSYRVDTSVQMNALPKTGADTPNNVITRNARTIAQAEIAKREAAGEVLSPEEKARIENSHVTNALLDKSPFMHGVNAEKARSVRQAVEEDPTLLSDPFRMGLLLRQINGSDVLPPTKVLEVDNRARAVKHVLDNIDEMRAIIQRGVGVAGASNRVFAPAEAIGNILGFVSDTDRARFNTLRDTVRYSLPELMHYKGSGSSSKAANEEIQNIVRGGGFGDTFQNVMSTSELLQQRLADDLSGLRTVHVRNTGRDVSIFAPPATPQNPGTSVLAPRQQNTASAPQPQAPQPQARPQPAPTQPANTSGFVPATTQLKAGVGTKFDDGSVWTLINGKAVRVK